MSALATKLRVAALPTLWIATALLMVRDWRNDPYDPRRVARDPTGDYGHNGEDSLANGLVFTLIELMVFVAILRPWSYDRSWGRALVAVVLLLPWTVLSMVASMHAGGVVFLHFSWLFVLLFGIFVAFLVSAIASYRDLTR